MGQVVAAVAAVATWFAGLNAVAQALVQIAVATAVSFASSALLGRGPSRRQTDVTRELARPNSLTPYRFVYGRRKIYGSPAPYIVQDETLFCCFILNSRPSHGGEIEIFIDKRRVRYTGDITNINEGAEAITPPFDQGDESRAHAKFWVGLGDQTKCPPEIVAEAPDLFEDTDAWRGLTVLWARFSAGDTDERLERWPRVPPEVEVRMNWSKVWDPRDPDQDHASPNKFTYSANRSLVVLDLLMRNPIRAYPLSQIDVPSFRASANIDDEVVPLKGGGGERRWQAHGIVVFDGVQELEELVEPIARSGVSLPIRMGGKVGMSPGAWEDPEFTVTDLIDDGFTFEIWKPGRDLVSAVAARYVSPNRDDEMAALVPYKVPGANEDDHELGETQDLDLGYVTSATQAMRVQQVSALRNRQQRRIAGTLPPSAVELVAGSRVRVALPAPYERMNGFYEVESITPIIEIAGDSQDGVALKCPVELHETAESTWAWIPEEDEQDIVDGIAVAPDVKKLSPPTNLLLTSNSTTDLSGEPRILARWDASPSARTVSYAVRYREATPGPWQSAGEVDADQIDGGGKVFAYIAGVETGTAYDVRVRALAPGLSSTWLQAGPITASTA